MKLEKIWYKNTGRCSYMPMLGADLRHAATIDDPKDLSQLSWNAQGFIHCSNAHKGYNWFWKRTSYLSNLVCTFDTCLERNQAIISRFVDLLTFCCNQCIAYYIRMLCPQVRVCHTTVNSSNTIHESLPKVPAKPWNIFKACPF